MNEISKLDPNPEKPSSEPGKALEPIKNAIRQADAPPPPPPVDIQQNIPTIDLQKHIDRLENLTDEILLACRNDRAETQEVINLLKKQVEDDHKLNKKLDRGAIDGLVKALEVKSNINTTAVKMIEANIKSIAAQKPNQVNQNNILLTDGSNKELMDILARSDNDDGY